MRKNTVRRQLKYILIPRRFCTGYYGNPDLLKPLLANITEGCVRGWIPEVTSPPVRRTCCRTGSPCCFSGFDSLFREAIYAPPIRRLALSESKKTTTYRDLVDELTKIPRIRDALDLDSIPAPSTLCKAFGRLEIAIWRVLLNVSLADLL
jgi:hypothetical protein